MTAQPKSSDDERLRVLFVEDSLDDAEQAIRRLEKAGYRCDWERVHSGPQMEARLAERFDVILSDYNLPGFDGLTALRMVRERDRETPFIIVSGAIGEERAIESLKAGATDYVLKERLNRLVPAVQRALSERQQRQSRERAESALAESEAEQERLKSRLAATIDALPAHIAMLDPEGNVVAVNDAWRRFARANEYAVAHCGVGVNYLAVCDAMRGTSLEEGRAAARGIRAVLDAELPEYAMEYACHSPSERRWFRMVVTPSVAHQAEGAVVMHLDISDRRLAEAAMRYRADLESLLMHTSRRFLDCKPDRVDAIIEDSLRYVGSFLGIDWAFLLHLSTDRATLTCTHEWCAPGVAPRRDLYAEIRVEEMPWSATAPWVEPLVVDRVEALPTEMGAEKALLQAAGVQSAVLVPLLYNSTVIGLLGFASTSEICEWSADEFPLLKILGEMYVSAFVRQRDTTALDAEAEADAAIARFVEELIRSLGDGRNLERLCCATAEALRCETSHTLLWDEGERVFRNVGSFGESEQEREVSRLIALPRTAIGGLLVRLETVDATEVASTATEALVLPPHRPSRQLCMALCRGGDLIGLQVASRSEGAEPFTAMDRRVAERIARLSSLALDHARVLAALESSNRLKSDFVATMSHELRTPLNIIMGYNELMLDGAFGDLNAEQASCAQRIRRSASDLLGLVDDTLDLGRIERGESETLLADVDLGRIIDDVCREVRPLAETAELELRARLPRGSLVVSTDAAKVRTIIRNLLVNAIKFTATGSVALTVKRLKSRIAIAVVDTGIGIEPHLQSAIFEPFRQGESSPTRQYGGVGLGLYIARRLATLIGGTIEVASTPGKGATFTLSLPR